MTDHFGAPVPSLRIFDEVEARDPCLCPLGISLGSAHLGEPHLAQQHRNATPGSAIRVAVADVDGFSDEISRRGQARRRSGAEDRSRGARDLDPVGNWLGFSQDLPA